MSSPFGSKSWPVDPTMPSTAPAGYTTPTLPNSSRVEPPMTSAQIAARRNQFYEFLIREIVKIITGFFIPGAGPAADQLSNWATGLLEGINTGAEAVAGFLSNVFLVNDFKEIITNSEDGDPNDLGSWFNARVNDSRSLIINIVNGLTGALGTDWLHPDALQSLKSEAATVAELSNAIAQLQNQNNNNNQSGNSALIDFSIRANATNLGADFTQTYSGAGTSTWGVASGRADWYVVYDDVRSCQGHYNVKGTLSDYQMIGCAFGAAPEYFNASAQGYSHIFGRVNAAGDSYIYVQFSRYNLELGCVVSGVKTVFVIEPFFTFHANTVYWLRCGTIGGARVFQVLEGSSPIITHTEVGTTSQLGASFRDVSISGIITAGPFGVQRPGRIASFAFSDNFPPTIVGSGASINRASTGSVNAAAGSNIMPANFFDVIGNNTTDITVDLTNGKFTVSMAGWYVIKSSITITGFMPDRHQYYVAVNGTVKEAMSDQMLRGTTAALATVTPGLASGITFIHLQAGDYVQLAYVSTNAVVGTWTGDAAGFNTYFSIALANRSLA